MFYHSFPTGKLSKVIDPLGNIALYTYDEMDQIIEVCRLGEDQVPLDEDLKDAIALNEENRCRITRYKRNQMGQVESICDALGHEEHFKYNLRGELIEKMDKEEFLTTYAYTPHGDVEQIQYADGKEVKMKYNQLRQLTEIQDCLGTTKISLDYLGRPLEVVEHNNKAVTYEWGKLGEKRKISYPGGQVVNYDYDDVLRMIEVDDGTSKVSYRYDECSRLSEKRFASGLKTSIGYNAEGKLREIVHQNPEEVLDSFEYQYDLAGNRTMIKKYRSGLPEDTGLFEYTYCSNKPLNHLDLDGNFDKPDHDELTYYAGIILGLPPEVIGLLQWGNRDVDAFFGATNPYIGSQPHHFDRSEYGEVDTRLVIADQYLERATLIAENLNFTVHGEPIMPMIIPYYLGRGLHPIQDIHAHGQIDAGERRLDIGLGHAGHSFNIWFGIGNYRGNPDSFYYDWLGDCQVLLVRVPDRRLNMRYLMAILDSVDYLNRFQEETGFSLKDILY